MSPLLTSGGVVVVNRGWVPVGLDRSVLPDVGVTSRPVTVTGRIVPPPASGVLLGETGYDSLAWPKVVQTVDLERMGSHLGTPPLAAIVLLDPSDPACLSCDWKPVAGITPDRHRGYAVQWFALAAALVVLLVVVGVRGSRRHGR